MVFFSFIHIKKEDLKNLPTDPLSPAIIVANHTSMLDVFIIEALAGTYPHIWIIKHSYLKIPLFSTLIKRMHVSVNRKNTYKAGKALLKAYQQAKQTTANIIIFPEGTRHHDGKIHDFHAGFALLAKKLNRPVIPIFTTGLHKILPKGKLILNYKATKPYLSIGKPIMIEKNESIETFKKRIHQWFKEKLAKQKASSEN